MISAERVAREYQDILNTRLTAFIGLKEFNFSQGRSELSLIVDAKGTSTHNKMHAGVVYMLCEVACYTSLLHDLEEEEMATTIDSHFNFLRPVIPGEKLDVHGRLLRRGKGVAFMEAEAFVNGKMVARATITKAIITTHYPRVPDV
jgi:uncharacterized protein (TIGR00369 family)